MKTKLYLYLFAIGIIAALFDPVKSFSQCNCSAGVPADSIIYTATMSPTTESSYTLAFPKFDPAIGTLSCVKITAILQGASTATGTITSTDNKAIAKRFKWLLSISPTIEAPTTSVSRTFTANYGPDSLATQPYIDSLNHITDSINNANPDADPLPLLSLTTSKTYGPEDLFLSAEFIATGPASAAYYSNPSAPVEVYYSIGGYFVPTEGPLNYSASISSLTSGTFNLYYYWCPSAVLANNIKNFLTTFNKDRVNTQWQAQNQVADTKYELQVSSDGKNFKTVYVQTAKMEEGGTGNYSYQYNLDKTTGNSPDLYFRIKETTINGKTTYSGINTVSLSGMANQMDVFPNPATNKVGLQFEKEVNGNFIIDIVSLTGQRVFTKEVTLAKTKFVQVELVNPPSQGMYYVRATDKRSGAIYVNKLIMKAP